MFRNLSITLLKKGAASVPVRNHYCIARNTLCLSRIDHCTQPWRKLHRMPTSGLTIMQRFGAHNLMDKIRAKVHFLRESKYVLKGLGYMSYEHIIDQVDYNLFYEEFNMPDTFFSWFLITELHVWMLMLRFMANEPKAGKILRNSLVEAMWHDCEIRSDKLGNIPGSIKRKQFKQLTLQFNAAIIAYDEGILSDDKVLAGALWRTFFNSSCSNPEQLEKLVHYVRKNVNMLDNLSSQQVRTYYDIKWADLRSIS